MKGTSPKTERDSNSLATRNSTGRVHDEATLVKPNWCAERLRSIDGNPQAWVQLLLLEARKLPSRNAAAIA